MDQFQYSILLYYLPQKARASHPLLLNLRNALGSIVFGYSNSKHRSLAGVAQESDGSALGFWRTKCSKGRASHHAPFRTFCIQNPGAELRSTGKGPILMGVQGKGPQAPLVVVKGL